jgi:hypothetical protein
VLYLVIPLFATCQGWLLGSVDHCGCLYVLCGDHLLVDICRNFLHESFAPFYCVFCLRLLCVTGFQLVVFLFMFGVVVAVIVMTCVCTGLL